MYGNGRAKNREVHQVGHAQSVPNLLLAAENHSAHVSACATAPIFGYTGTSIGLP